MGKCKCEKAKEGVEEVTVLQYDGKLFRTREDLVMYVFKKKAVEAKYLLYHEALFFSLPPALVGLIERWNELLQLWTESNNEVDGWLRANHGVY